MFCPRFFILFLKNSTNLKVPYFLSFGGGKNIVLIFVKIINKKVVQIYPVLPAMHKHFLFIKMYPGKKKKFKSEVLGYDLKAISIEVYFKKIHAVLEI